nr:serine/threonine-protein kinase TNNI3K-like [Ipomoea batatas]
MEGLASLSVKSVIPTRCFSIPRIKEYLVDIEKREVKEGDEDQFQDKKQTLLLKLIEPESRKQISIVAHFVHVNSIIKEMRKFYDLINLNNPCGTKPLKISVLMSAESSNAVRSIKGMIAPTPPPPPLPPTIPGLTDITINNPAKQSSKAAEGSRRGFYWPPSGVVKCNDSVNLKQQNVILIMAMLTAATTFLAACSFAGVVSQDSETTRDYSSLAGPFVLLNSAGFIASVAVIMSVLHQLPLKPWPQISVCSWFGSYMCLMMKLSPHEALLLLCVSVPLLMLTAMGKLIGFSQ